jgi:lantibiotic modifying enzyme
MSWKPLLTGEQASLAEAAVSAIADALLEPPEDVLGYSLSAGLPGVALFFAYLSRARSDTNLAGFASAQLAQALDKVAAEDSPALGLLSGLSGLAWAWQHIENLLYGEVSFAGTEELDEMILEAVQAQPWRWEWDLGYGLAGIGLYALDHPNRSFSLEATREIIERLSELAQELPEGIAWKTKATLMTPSNAKKYPNGRWDQGVAHGVPGVIGFLGTACERGIAVERARSLLDRSLAWLLANTRGEEEGSCFTYFPPDMVDARSGWCYGDPGVAAVLVRVGRALDEPSWRDFATSVACRAARRSMKESGVADASLCHGAAGLGHIYNRLFQATGENDLAGAAKAWFGRALLMRNPKEGVGGYSSWWPEIEEWRGEGGFLVGAAGIGLSLLSAISPVEPLWDGPLLLPR